MNTCCLLPYSVPSGSSANLTARATARVVSNIPFILTPTPKVPYFFFYPEQFTATHSLDFQDFFFFFSLLVKKKNTRCFSHKFQSNVMFFFFLRKSLKSTHSLKFRTVKKKKQPGEKKKNRIFTHSVDFFQNVVKIKLFRGKKNTIPLPAPTTKKIWGYHKNNTL